MAENPGLSSRVKRFFERFKTRAAEYTSDPEKTKELGEKAANKAEKHRGKLDEIWDDLQTLFRLVKAWTTHKYTVIPVKSIIMIIAGLIYFVSPVDAVPDFIVGLGLLDDAAVLGFVISAARSDIDAFRQWESAQSS